MAIEVQERHRKQTQAKSIPRGYVVQVEALGPVPRSEAPGANPAERGFLSLLEGVRAVSPNTFMASCPVPGHGAGRGDRNPSLSIRLDGDGRLRVHCFAGCSPAEVLAALAVGHVGRLKSVAGASLSHPARREDAFTSRDAAALWERCLDAVRDGRDGEVREYLRLRGIPTSPEGGLFGQAPPRWSPYLLAVPLFDTTTGDLMNVQMRRIDKGGEPKVRVPRGSRVAGTAFMNARSREIVRAHRDPVTCIFGEGLTDFLALAQATDLPVLSAAGVGNASGMVGTWVKGRTVLLAFDADKAGESAAGRVARRVLREGGHPLRLTWPSPAKDACDLISHWGFRRFQGELGEAIKEHVS